MNAPIDTRFPRPLVDPLPLTMGVKFSEEFSTFRHVEEIPGDREWTVTLGPANRAMFTRLFGAMFRDMVVLSPPASAGDEGDEAGAATGTAQPAAASPEGLDAILEPTIESYEFANPLEADDEYTTVWITYRMRLTDPEGRLIAEWPVRAYGRGRYGFLGAKDSLVEATELAMRDAGAYIAVYFADEPRVREWLRETGRLEEAR